MKAKLKAAYRNTGKTVEVEFEVPDACTLSHDALCREMFSTSGEKFSAEADPIVEMKRQVAKLKESAGTLELEDMWFEVEGKDGKVAELHKESK